MITRDDIHVTGDGNVVGDHAQTIVNKFTLAGGKLPVPPALQPVAPPVPFVGRAGVRQTLAAALRTRRGAVHTLAGLGGVGKTALAARVTHDVAADFPGGILWLSLEAAPAPATLWAQVVAAYGYAAPVDPAGVARALLNEHQPLIVVDNAEAAPETARAILRDRGRATALVTTRDRAVTVGFGRPRGLEPLPRAEAIDLFLVGCGGEGLAQRPVAGEICALLGDLPLAVTLAAGYVTTYDLTPEAYLDLLRESPLGESLHLGARRDLSVSVTLDLSCDRLDDDGRLALTVLALDGGDSVSMEALAAGAGWYERSEEGEGQWEESEEEKDTEIESLMRQLRALVEGMKSTREPDVARARRAGNELVRRSLARREGARLRTHPLVRRHVVEGCAGEQREEMEGRLVAHYLAYAEAHAEPTAEAYDALEAEQANLLAAMDRAYAREAWARVRRFAWALCKPVSGYLGVRGYWTELRTRLEQAVRAAEAEGHARDAAAFAGNLATILENTGHPDAARREYERVLAIFEDLGERKSVAVYHHQLGVLAQDQGEYAEARRRYEASLEIAEALGNRAGIASTLGQLGVLAQDQGEYAEARRRYEASLEIAEALGNRAGIALSLHQLGILAQAQGEYAEARRRYEASLEIKEALGNRAGIAATLGQLANLADDEDDLEEAEALYRRALAIGEEIGDVVGASIQMFNLALLCGDQGRLEESLPLLESALSTFERLGSPHVGTVRPVLERVRAALNNPTDPDPSGS